MPGGHEGMSISAVPELVSDFVPSPGGPFSALTSSMWPQDILHRLSNPVCLTVFFNYFGPLVAFVYLFEDGWML